MADLGVPIHYRNAKHLWKEAGDPASFLTGTNSQVLLDESHLQDTKRKPATQSEFSAGAKIGGSSTKKSTKLLEDDSSMNLAIIGDKMILKKCPKCKQKFSNEQELEHLEKEVGKKNKCKCGSKLITNVTEISERKIWFGYISINNDKRIDHMVLVEKNVYDNESVEVRIPLLRLEFETKDRGSWISRCDEDIERYLMETYGKRYDKEHQFVTPAYCEEEKKIISNTENG